MLDTVRIKHLENPNITTFVNGKQINIRNFEATVSIEDAKEMMAGPFGYELIGVYDDFQKYVNELFVRTKLIQQSSAPFSCVVVGTPLTLHKLYSWDKYTEALLNLEGRRTLHLVFVLDETSGENFNKVEAWCELHKEDFYGITLLIWDADKSKAWNRIFKITVNRQLIFKYARTLASVTHVWFIDSDNIVPNFALKRLLEVNREVSAGLYNFKSVIAGGPVVFNIQGDWNWPPTCLGDQQRGVKKDTGLIETDWTGAGCLLISKKIFDKYNFDWNKWVQRNGEDAWMCLCAQHETGQRVIVDTSVFCDHLDDQGNVW